MKKKKLSELVSVEEFDPSDMFLILNCAIMHDDFCAWIYKKYKQGQIKSKYFESHYKRIFWWIIKFYSEYKKAPKETIGEIFKLEQRSMQEETIEVISLWLDGLAEDYLQLNEDGIDLEWVKKTAVSRFVKRQEAELKINELQKGLDTDDDEHLDKTLSDYSKFTFEDEDEDDLGVSKPGSIKAVKSYYTQEKDKNAMYKLNGAIGDFIGPIYRGKVYAFTGIEKSGKSYLMQEAAWEGVAFHKLKCLDINLEMPVDDKNERFWQRATGMAVDEEHSGNIITPIFDCENNQFGTCQIRKHKLNKKDLLSSKDDLVYFVDRKRWKVCTKCRNIRQRKNALRTKKFIPTIWFKNKKVRPITEKRLTRAIKQKQPYGIGNYRIKCFPRFSATMDDIIDFIYRYIDIYNFDPDIVILDYPDVTAPIEGKLMDRHNIDYNWKTVARLGAELDCAMFIADQATKDERKKRSLSNMCTSESKTKDAHLDMRISLNMIPTEYDLGLQRIGMLFRRKGRLQNSEIMITRRLETGNVILDSEWWFNNNTHYPVAKYPEK